VDDQIGEHHVLGAETAGERCRREGVGDLAQQAARFTDAGGHGGEQRRVVEIDLDTHADASVRRRRNSGSLWSTAAW
jgi:hypothetical protein